MSLQDDIFDVEHALEGKPEAVQFDRIYTALGYFEHQHELCSAELNQLKQALSVVGTYLQPKEK